MKKRKKNLFIELITDIKHHIGWILTTAGIIGIFHLLGVHGLHNPWYHIPLLHAVIIGIDILKHLVKLQ